MLERTKAWVETMVIGLNLCPFAKQEWDNNRVRCTVSSAQTPELLLMDLENELVILCNDMEVETTLLIHPHTLTVFEDYIAFLDTADALLEHMNLISVFQIASFHPHYCFADVDNNDVTNYTNRAPFPVLHLLREESLARAIDSHHNAQGIPEDNMALMRKMGILELERMLSKH